MQRFDLKPGTETFTASPVFVSNSIQARSIQVCFPHREFAITKTFEELDFPYCIDGEPFAVAIENTLVIIRHPDWSLMGVGTSVFEALLSLMSEARELGVIMREMPIESLDFETLRLKNFVVQFQ